MKPSETSIKHDLQYSVLETDYVNGGCSVAMTNLKPYDDRYKDITRYIRPALMSQYDV
jgi:hypothetical protein